MSSQVGAKRWQHWFLLLGAPVLVYLGALNLADRTRWKNPADGIRWEVRSDGLYVAGGELPVGVAVGYRLADVGGVAVDDLDGYAEVLESLVQPNTSGTVVDYGFVNPRDGGQIVTPVQVRWASPLRAIDLALLLVGAGFLLVGMVTFFRRPLLPGAFHFALLCLVAYCLLVFRYSGRADAFDVAVYWISGIAFLLLPPLLVHFCLKFPAPAPAAGRWIAAGIYAPAVLLGALHAGWFLGRLDLVGWARTPRTAAVLDRLELAHFLVGMLAAAGLLWAAYRRADRLVERKQLQWIFAGAVLGILPFAVLYAVPFLLGWPLADWMEASVLSLILVPISLSYAVSRFRLQDVGLYAKRGAAYILASGCLLGAFVLFAVTLVRTLEGITPDAGYLLLGALTVLLAICFEPLRRRIQDQLDRRFYRERYAYRRSVLDFGRSLAAEVETEAILGKVLHRIDRALDVSEVGIYLQDEKEPDRFVLAGVQGFEDIPEVVRLSSRELELLSFPGLVTGEDGSLSVLDAANRRRLGAGGVRYVEGLQVRHRVIGFMVLGAARDGDLLSSEDHELLSTLAAYVAVALDNARLYASLQTKANELAELRAYAESVIESIRLGVAVVDATGRVTVWNHAMGTLFGHDRRAAAGRSLEELFPEDLLAALRRVSDGPNWMVREVRGAYRVGVRGPAGRRLVNVTLTPFITRSNANVGTLIVIDDITERVRLESQLQQAERLSSIGVFAAGVAHEVNTPLAAISSYAQMLLEETPADDKRRPLLEKIERQSFRASDILNSLLNFARSSDRDFEEVNVNSVLLDTLSLIEHQFKRASIEVELDLDPAVPKTVGNGGKLAQVFMNLFLNARDAMPQGGRLRLVTRSRDSELLVQIQDSGVGISEEDIRRIYDPFFTTKEVGKGTGLGLAVTYGIIQEHAGRIDVASSPGKGTVFSIYLPVRRVQ
ncbi:MAG: hypothetical protein Kow00109_00480 [Acidobacteriota bacterium]